MRHLFNDYEASTAEGNALSEKIEKALRPIFLDAQQTGASMRDVCNIGTQSVTILVAEMVLKAALTRRKAERENVYTRHPHRDS